MRFGRPAQRRRGRFCGWFAPAALVAILVHGVGCRPHSAPGRVDASPAASASLAPASSAPSALSSRSSPARASLPDPLARALETAPLVRLVLRSRPGRGPLAAELALGPSRPAMQIELTLAETSSPKAYARPLAFHALSRALGFAVAAPTALRPFGLAELGDALGSSPDAPELLRRLAVQNDGTVDGLLVAVPDGARVASAEESVEAVRCLRLASASDAGLGDDAARVRGYVELLVLDYLAGNGLRRAMRIDDAHGSLVAADNAGAFPLWTDPRIAERLLGRLRGVQRFPRGLRDALARLDRRTAESVFSPGAFETWLLPPRALIELDERRLTLLTFLDARIEALGPDRVLSL